MAPSTPDPFLGCDPYTQAYNDAYVQGMSEQDRLAYVAPFLKTCVDDLKATGIDISAYNTEESAADVLDIVTALGYDHFAYAGQSYGTLLGQFVVEQAGDRLDAIVLDGVVPKSKVSQVQDGGDKTQRVFQAIFAACKQDPACAAAYPEFPEQQLVALYDQLQATPIDLVVQSGDTSIPLKVDGTLFINGLYSAISGAPNLANLPRALALAAAGHPSAIADYVGANISSGHSARVEHYSVVCWDDPVTSVDQAVTADDVLDPYVRLAESNALEYIDSCPVVTAPGTAAGLDDPVVSDVPALFLSGGLDPTTPASQAAEVAAGFSHSTQLTNPAGTHVQMIYDPCFQGIVAAFLKDPSATPDSACVAQEPALPAFVVDQTVSVPNADSTHTLTFTVPSDYVTTNGISVDHLNKRYLLPVFGAAGQSAADAAAAAAAQLSISGLTDAGTTKAGTHDATLYQGAGEVQGVPVTVDIVMVDTPDGVFGVMGAGLAELQSAMRTVDLPVAAASLTIDGK